MKHLVFIITQGWVQYRLNNQQGSHPMGDDSAQQVIDYLKRIIPHDTTETIFGWHGRAGHLVKLPPIQIYKTRPAAAP